MALNPVDVGDLVIIMLEGLALSESSMRCSIIWAGTEIPCTGSGEMESKKIDEGGFRLETQVKVKVRKTEFPTGIGFPALKQTFLYKRSANSEPKKYRIDAIINHYDAVLELWGNDPAQGA